MVKGKEFVNLLGLALVLVGLIYLASVVVDVFSPKWECTPLITEDIKTTHIDCTITYPEPYFQIFVWEQNFMPLGTFLTWMGLLLLFFLIGFMTARSKYRRK